MILGDVARIAGVGPATVDRVINDRGGVSPQTAARVLRAARLLGLRRTLPLPHQRTFRFAIVLLKSNLPFFDRLGSAFRAAAAALGEHVVVHLTFVDPESASQRVDCIDQALDGTFAGIVLVSTDEERVRAAIGRATRRGVPVLTLLTDLPDTARLAYVGIDNIQAGRTAAHIMRWSAAAGNVLAVVGDHSFHGHAGRVAGFRTVLEAGGPSLRLAETVVGGDDAERTYSRVAASLARWGVVTGIYNAGGAVPAVAAAIRAAGGQAPFHVAHELTAGSRALLRSGELHLVIDQNPEMQGRRAMEILASTCGLGDAPIDHTPIPFALHCAENAG